MDSQMIELIGRNRLIDELLHADLEVALPLRDRGIDLIAYADLSSKVKSFAAIPIQMKAASRRSFAIEKKYAKISNLILAHVWHLGKPKESVTYAMSYPQAVLIAEEMGWTKTKSWERGGYATTNPSNRLCKLLEPHRMNKQKWWEVVVRLENTASL